MRMPIAMMLAAAVALSPAPALAQAYNDTATGNAAEPEADANVTAADTPVDANMAVATTEAPPADTALANDAAEARKGKRDRTFPWGVLGLVGLVGLLGRRRA